MLYPIGFFLFGLNLELHRQDAFLRIEVAVHAAPVLRPQEKSLADQLLLELNLLKTDLGYTTSKLTTPNAYIKHQVVSAADFTLFNPILIFCEIVCEP